MRSENATSTMSKSTPTVESEDAFYINHLRALAVDCVQAAKSGHPGMPLGMAPCAYVLFTEFLKFDASSPKWFDRDRFVLSNGHGCTLLYSLLHLCGYEQVSIEALSKFRQLGSCTPGHPERGITDGVEVTTGPLGQGIANGVGMAITESHLAARLNVSGETPIIDHYTYVFCGDGCLMEGVGQEALSLAGHLGLSKLIIIYDDNKITIDGSTALAFTEDSAAKYASMGFEVFTIHNGDTDTEEIRRVLHEARSSTTDKPKFVIVKTTIGYGSSLAGSASAHGAPLGDAGVQDLKRRLGISKDLVDKPFFVPMEAYHPYWKAAKEGSTKRVQWNGTLAKYKALYENGIAVERDLFKYVFGGELPDAVDRIGAGISHKLSATMATRKASEVILESLVQELPFLFGGSADLSCSNLTIVAEQKQVSYQKATPHGRYMHYGVREHAMAAIGNGIVAHGGLIPYFGTFLNFLGYCAGAVRLSALSHLGVIYVATHDSIGLGEDGPTHQPVEISALLRAMPNLLVFRPADARETLECWKLAIQRRETPSVLCLSRQALSLLPGEENRVAERVARGGYVAHFECRTKVRPNVVLVSTGSEVSLCLDAAKQLLQSVDIQCVSVVSMPCMELFRQQPVSYIDEVLPPGVPVVAVEAWTSLCWGEFAHATVCLDSFGCSAPAADCYAFRGITAEEVTQKALALCREFHQTPAPSRRFFHCA
ncbi:transketolase [Perkinsela sp. CCAP 1560/4]|nr:transketolase [Perkinsela sp. CCAP 1560/4]|eukprot:KNH05478.1 transketolase [Perkinsela sp. CCAP 1560/4]